MLIRMLASQSFHTVCHSTGARVSLIFIVNLDGLGVECASGQFGR
jgi:hypothetical protein